MPILNDSLMMKLDRKAAGATLSNAFELALAQVVAQELLRRFGAFKPELVVADLLVASSAQLLTVENKHRLKAGLPTLESPSGDWTYLLKSSCQKSLALQLAEMPF